MLETWARMRIISEFIVPGIIAGSALILLLICLSPIIVRKVKASREERKKLKILFDCGFERYLYDVASVGNGEFYAWRKNGKFIRERDLWKYSIPQLRQWITEVENAS